MKSTLALLGLLALGTTAAAAQLPNQTLYVQPTSLERSGATAIAASPASLTAYIAYETDPATSTDEGGPIGGGIEAMSEDVAVTLKGMTLDHVYKCDAHVMQSLNRFQVFQLTNCK